MYDLIDRFSRDGLWRHKTPIAATWVPVINIEDTGKRLIVTADVPGEELKDLDII